MQKYSPRMYDPRDDRKPWATMEANDMGSHYNAADVEAHIAEMQRSHDVTTAMLKASLVEAQKAIERLAGESKQLDEQLRATREELTHLEDSVGIVRP